jgi:hypothetical protein
MVCKPGVQVARSIRRKTDFNLLGFGLGLLRGLGDGSKVPW